MPRSSSGNYSLPVAAFVPGGLIKSADDNSNLGDIAAALTQSLATTGVSTMTGALIGAAGLVTTPGYTFNGATKTGFYLAGTNQIGWASNGVQGATFNADTSVTFAGKVSALQGTIPIGAVIDFAGSAAPAGWLLCFGQLVSTTTYAALFAVLGTTYGSGGGTFGIPDYRGRATFGKDNMGGAAASRITVAGGNFDGTVLGGPGGGQNQTITTAQLPVTTISVTGAAATFSSSYAVLSGFGSGGIAAVTTISQGGGGTLSGNVTFQNMGSVTFGSGTSVPIMNPAIITNKLIYAGV